MNAENPIPPPIRDWYRTFAPAPPPRDRAKRAANRLNRMRLEIIAALSGYGRREFRALCLQADPTAYVDFRERIISTALEIGGAA